MYLVTKKKKGMKTSKKWTIFVVAKKNDRKPDEKGRQIERKHTEIEVKMIFKHKHTNTQKRSQNAMKKAK